jgi:hypothetical protein
VTVPVGLRAGSTPPSLGVAGLLLLFACLQASTAHALVERFAVIVSNNRGGESDGPLRYAATDAERMHDVLRDLGGFEPVNTVVLREENADTVKSTLIAINDRIRQRISLPDTQVMLFFYYSGHADAEQLHLGRSALSIRELTQLISGSAAHFRIAVLDACRSGAITRSKGGRIVAPFPLIAEETLPGQGLAFLTASASDEDAQESEELRGSFFTHAFVSGLLGAADTNRDGQVALDEAYRHAYAGTLRATSRTFAGTQHPTFRYDFRGQGDLILTRPSAHASERAHLHAPNAMDVLVLQGSEHGVVVAEVGSGVQNRMVSVRPGRFFVRVRARDVLYEGAVDAPAGASVAIDVDELDRVEYARLVRKGEGGADTAHAVEVGGRLRSVLPNAETVCIGGFVGYGIDFQSLGLRTRIGACTSHSDGNAVDSTVNAYDADVRVYHAWDMARLTLELGLGVGGSVFRQTFSTRGSAPTRTSFVPFLAIGAATWLDLGGAYHVGLDLNAETHVMPIDDGNGSTETKAAIALRTSLSLGRHF